MSRRLLEAQKYSRNKSLVLPPIPHANIKHSHFDTVPLSKTNNTTDLLKQHAQAKKEHAELEKIAENNSDYDIDMQSHMKGNQVKELEKKLHISSDTRYPYRKGGKSIKSRKNKNKKTLRVRKHRSTQHRKLLLA
jgi:predicted  nucleic acid-binding Zn ribbon protein